jgi:hypothetical protein
MMVTLFNDILLTSMSGSASGVLPVRGAFVIPLFGFLLPASALAEGRFSAYASKNIIPWPVSP